MKMRIPYKALKDCHVFSENKLIVQKNAHQTECEIIKEVYRSVCKQNHILYLIHSHNTWSPQDQHDSADFTQPSCSDACENEKPDKTGGEGFSFFLGGLVVIIVHFAFHFGICSSSRFHIALVFLYAHAFQALSYKCQPIAEPENVK